MDVAPRAEHAGPCRAPRPANSSLSLGVVSSESFVDQAGKRRSCSRCVRVAVRRAGHAQQARSQEAGEQAPSGCDATWGGLSAKRGETASTAASIPSRRAVSAKPLLTRKPSWSEDSCRNRLQTCCAGRRSTGESGSGRTAERAATQLGSRGVLGRRLRASTVTGSAVGTASVADPQSISAELRATRRKPSGVAGAPGAKNRPSGPQSRAGSKHEVAHQRDRAEHHDHQAAELLASGVNVLTAKTDKPSPADQRRLRHRGRAAVVTPEQRRAATVEAVLANRRGRTT